MPSVPTPGRRLRLRSGRATRAALAASLLTLGACGDAPSAPVAGGLTPTGATRATLAAQSATAADAADGPIVLSPARTTLAVGETVTLTARGSAVDGAGIYYWSTEPEIASVEAWTGKVTALRAGTARIYGVAQADGYPATTAEVVVIDAAATPAPVEAPAPTAPITMTPATSTLSVGGALQLAASGSAVSPGNVYYWSSDPTVAAVGPWTGVVTGLRAGTVKITGVAQAPGYPATQVSVSVVAGGALAPSSPSPSAPLAAAPPATTAPIALSPAVSSLGVGTTLQLAAIGTVPVAGQVYFWSSDPTIASVETWTGKVTGLRAGTVRVTGVAQAPGYPSAVATVTVAGSAPVAAPVAAPAPVAANAAAVLAFMGSADVPSVSAIQAKGGAWATFEATYAAQQELRWWTDGVNADANYYDRAMIYYVWWARTGNATYLERGHQLALNARAYLESANYQMQPYLLMIDGIALHAMLTGDQRSATAVARIADYLGGSHSPWPAALAENANGSIDSRSQARVLTTLLSARLLNVASPSGDDWGARLRVTLGYILRSQSADGAYRWSGQCYGNKPFMTGMLNDALIRYHTSFEPDARIPDAVKRAVDYMWSANWVPSTQGFLYQDGACTEGASADLNQLIVSGFGFVARQTGDASYFAKGDAVFNGGVALSYLNSPKHFNQNYSAAFHYLSHRF